jgi:aconitate hydratase
MGRAAQVARQATAAGLKTAVPLMVTPGSEQVRATIERDGQMKALEDLGASVLANACGPCIGQWKRDDVKQGEVNTIVSSFNRNFPRRNDGNPSTLSFITSPEMVVAYAVAGRLTFDPLRDALPLPDGGAFRFSPPGPSPDLPPGGFVKDLEGYVSPAGEGDAVAVAVSPDSERLQLLSPFPEWDGKDFVELPVLLKARGKCTTDHISPAGPWLRFRGHLDKISDNLFSGAVNAFTGASGKGLNVLEGFKEQPFSAIARSYKSLGVKWVAVGDENYGEGSSREHAAMEPRHLGAAAVIVRSFARIHESNLKKQGLLPLTFADPKDYDKVEETDRVSILGLKDLAPGKPVRALLHHADGTAEEIRLNHSLNAEQIAWFRAGSALNTIGKGGATG